MHVQFRYILVSMDMEKSNRNTDSLIDHYPHEDHREGVADAVLSFRDSDHWELIRTGASAEYVAHLLLQS